MTYPCCSHCDAGLGNDFCPEHAVPCCGIAALEEGDMDPNTKPGHVRLCVRCHFTYDIRLGGTDTHCPECLMKGLP